MLALSVASLLSALVEPADGLIFFARDYLYICLYLLARLFFLAYLYVWIVPVHLP